jgi:hypothetical protein
MIGSMRKRHTVELGVSGGGPHDRGSLQFLEIEGPSCGPDLFDGD